MEKKKVSAFMPFAIASAWFGTHCGGGFATGAQATSFWTAYGAWALLLPIISAVLMVLVAYWEWTFCYTFKTYNYRAFANKLFHPYEKIFGLIYELLFIAIMVMGVSSVFAGAGTLLATLLGIPTIIGIVIIIALTIALTIFGSQLLLRAASVLSTLLVTVMLIVTFVGLSKGAGRISEVVTTWETGGHGFLPACFSAILYASFQSVILGSMTNLTDGINSAKETKTGAWIGLALNGIMMILLTYMLLGWYPDVQSESLPILTILSSLEIPVLQYAYSIMLLLAFMTTAVTCIGSLLKRVENIGASKLTNITVATIPA